MCRFGGLSNVRFCPPMRFRMIRTKSRFASGRFMHTIKLIRGSQENKRCKKVERTKIIDEIAFSGALDVFGANTRYEEPLRTSMVK